jgi:hypothetical protein
MLQDPVEPVQHLVTGGVDDRDSRKILDLIEQLDRDLIETKKNAPERG